ncbi:hypothetical protein [Jatrophihabitans sp.]|uniref:hypothetical protein n=1 Tax=Jatrophihabitans sp. TaxID=1932789 RepID=UPI0030C67DCC|nr:hypothetical protein [Jatrophihabitans sp.]
MTALVVGVDPGVTTGIASLTYGTELLDRVLVQVHGSRAVKTIVEALLDSELARPLLAVEQFVVSTRAGRSGTAVAGRITRALIAELQALGMDHAAGTALEVVTRPAALVKPWASDLRLDAAGLLAPTKGMGHARDAARHALYAAVHSGIAVDPLSRKAAAR